MRAPMRKVAFIVRLFDLRVLQFRNPLIGSDGADVSKFHTNAICLFEQVFHDFGMLGGEVFLFGEVDAAKPSGINFVAKKDQRKTWPDTAVTQCSGPDP